MKFSELAGYFEEIEKNSSRLTITKLLSDLYKKLSADEIDKTIYLLQGRVCPIYEKIEFGMAERMIIKAAVSALSLEKNYFDRQFKKTGDIGRTVEEFKKQYQSFEEKDGDIKHVYNELYKIATASGPGSQDVKINTLATLIRQLDPLSTRFLVRIPQGVLRLGFSDMTVLDAFSWMIKGDKSLRGDIEQVYHVRPDLGLLGRVLKADGVSALKAIQPTVFTPILMMRAERLSSGEEIIKQIGRCAVEPKYDGFRLQVHFKKHRGKGGEVKLYSRNLEEVSFMYPDIIEGVNKEIAADEAIFEGEAIGYDTATGNFLPFQETVQRKRKYDIEAKAKEIPLKLFCFDLLYADGKNYIHLPFGDRRQKLEALIDGRKNFADNTILISPEEITDDGKKLELMFDDAITKGLEGIVAKKLDGVYQAGARGWNWIKFKRSYSSKIEDTIDCLVMGYDYGRGKRAGFGIGAFLVGLFDAQNDKFVTVAKIGTGLTDEEWKELKKKCERLKTKTKQGNYDVDKLMECDVWVVPKLIVEIKADEITRSPVHTAGRKLKASKSGKAFEVDVAGFALRFPRLTRFREDKAPTDATTISEIEKMFKGQGKK